MIRLRRIHLTDRRRVLFVAGLIGLGLAGASAVFAETSVLSKAGNALTNTITLILSVIVLELVRLLANLAGIFTSLLIWVAQYNVFLHAPVVERGWPIVRDLMNMMFIVALLIIAAGTVLRLQNYRYNRLLGKLIIMAFLVNFSKFIAVFLLQFAQIVMLTFVNSFRDVGFANITHMFGLDAVLSFPSTSGVLSDTSSNTVVFLSLLAGLIMMVVAFVVMLSMTVILFVRIIALWLLIILSPIAYALRILPTTERYATQWWSEFTKYAVVGPVLAFFLWISFALIAPSSCRGTAAACSSGGNPISDASTTSKEQAAVLDKTNTALIQPNFVSELLTINRMVTFLVATIFLMLGMQYAQKSGAAGSRFAGQVAKTGFGAAAAITGLNYIRDRSLAPVQGYLKERKRRREVGIQERTQMLGAQVDRGLSATVGQVGRGRAAMTGALGAGVRGAIQGKTGAQIRADMQAGRGLGLEQGTRAYRQGRQRVADYRTSVIDREAKEKDLAHADQTTLENMVRTGRGGTRAAAAITGLNSGTMNLNDAGLRNQIYQDISGAQNSPEVRKRYQDAMEKSFKRPSTKDETLRDALENSPDHITQLDAGEELGNRRRLDEKDTRSINALAESLSADKATAFRKTMYARQSDVAINAFHRNPKTGKLDAPGLVEAINRGEAEQRIIRAAQLRSYTDATGAVKEEADEVGKGLYQMHRQRGSLEKMGDGLSDEAKNKLYNNIVVDDQDALADIEAKVNADPSIVDKKKEIENRRKSILLEDDDRAKIANATGADHRAFRTFGPGEKDETFMGGENGAFEKYLQRYKDKFAETVMPNALQDKDVRQVLLTTNNLWGKHFRTIADRGNHMAKELDAMGEDALYVVDKKTGVRTHKPEVYDDTPAGKYQENARKLRAIGTLSKEFEWNMKNPQARAAAGDYIAGAPAGELSRIMSSASWKTSGKEIREAIGAKITVDEAIALHKINSLLISDSFKTLSGDLLKARKEDPRTAMMFHTSP